MGKARAAALIGALALAGCAANSRENRSEAAELAEMTRGRIAQAPTQCVSTSPGSLNSARVINGTLVYQDGSRLWLSDGPPCTSGTGDPIVILETYGAQLCANDRYRTVVRGGGSIPGPYCRVGRWIPYVKARSD